MKIDNEVPASSVTCASQISQLLSSLQKYWGYSDFRSLQQQAMLHVMNNQDSLVVLPTGGGKSLCYQVPAVSRPGLALVISPLISLMKDQVDSLQSVGVAAACINSMQSNREKADVADRIRSRELKLLYISPERVTQPRTLDFLSAADISQIAVDEAHCISQWGHDFRPEYRQLKTLRDAVPGVSVHGYTATATEKVRQDIVEQLGLRQCSVLVGSFDRPNLLYRVERRADPISQIQQILERHRGESGVIYCISRRNVVSTSQMLNESGYLTLPYHAGMTDEDRRRNQEAFIDEKVQIIVATVAFGMGIDKSNVRFVIHAEMPRSLENYQQESGRAGRDGLEAECVLLYSAGDVQTWEFLMKDIEDPEVLKASHQSLNAMQSYCMSMRCRHAQLVEYFGQTLEGTGCAACDCCLEEMEPVADADAQVIAQKILSSIHRQGERFGAAYTAQVLRGSRAKRIIENHHDRLSTWGLLKNESEPQLRNWLDQLISQGYLRTAGEFKCLEITTTGRQVLKGLMTPALLRSRATESSVTPSDPWTGVNRELFEELRHLRHTLAVKKSVPPYIIFSDATLRELACFRPTRTEQLTSIVGIGERKKQEFGSLIVQTVAEWCQRNKVDTDLPPSRGNRQTTAVTAAPRRAVSQQIRSEYSDLFEQQLSMEDVALQLGRSIDTVSRHLAEYMTRHQITETGSWVPAAMMARIEEAVGRLGCERLKPLFEDLDSEISYAHLRIAVTAWKIRHR